MQRTVGRAFVDNADEAVEVQAEEHPGGVVNRRALGSQANQ